MPRIIEVEQGSTEWRTTRLGRPTASRFEQIIMPKTLKYSSAADGLIAELLAEKVLGYSLEDFDGNQWTHRGTEMEAEAVRWYAFQRDVTVTRVGFVETEDGRVGCSPDGLVGDVGGLEIKCRGAKAHMRALLQNDAKEMTKVRCQIQGSLWVTGREWWDLLAYNPAFPPVLLRYTPDPDFQEAFGTHMARFLADFDKAEALYHALGPQGRTDSLERQLAASLT